MSKNQSEVQNTQEKLWTRNFIIITIINMLIYLSWQMFPPVLPGYLKSLGGADNIIGWANGISTIATLIVRPFSGRIMDRFGRKGVFVFGLVLSVISVAAHNFSDQIGIILAIRFAHGLGWGISSTACSTIATDNISKKQLGRGMSYFSISISVSTAIGPALGLGVKVSTMIWIALGFLMAAILMNLFMSYPVTEKPSEETNESFYEKKSFLATALMFLLTITYGAILSFVPIFAASKGIENIGAFYVLFALGMMISRPFIGNILDRNHYNGAVAFGAIFTVLALVLLGFANNLIVILLCGLIYGTGYGVLFTCLQTMSLLNVSKYRSGAANATFFTGYDAGIGVGSVLGGILSGILGYGMMFVILAMCPIIIIVIYQFSRKNRHSIS